MKNLVSVSLLLAAISFIAPAQASTFTALKVVQAPVSDPLNARNWPSMASAVARTYTNGNLLSGTGRCKNTVTNISFRIDGPQSNAWKYNKMKTPNTWCQIWHEAPNGSGIFKAGWVRGRHVKPM